MNRYETVFILTPVLSEEQAKEAVGTYLDLLKGEGSKIVHTEDWGLRKLAYPIQKKSNGFYFLVEFEAEGHVIAKAETQYKRDERMLRWLTMSMDKHAIAWAEKKRMRAKSGNSAQAETANS